MQQKHMRQAGIELQINQANKPGPKQKKFEQIKSFGPKKIFLIKKWGCLQ